MSSYLSSFAQSVTPYTPGEQPRDRRYIKLNTNENAYPPSPRVAEAIAAAAGGIAQSFEALRLYPDPTAKALKAAFAKLYGVRESQVFVGNGSDEVLAFAFAAFFEGGRIAAPAVTYSFYPVYAHLYHAEYVTVPMLKDFAVDVVGLLATGAPVVLANPNAPTSTALEPQTVLHMAEVLRARGQVLLVDEAYAAFSDCSVAKHCDDFDNLLITGTLSKSHALAGLRVGFAIGNEALIDGLERMKNCFNSYTLDHLAIGGACAALEDTAYTDARVADICQTRDLAAKTWQSMGFTVLPSAANFLFVQHPKHAGKTLFLALREKGILVRHFATPVLTDWLRISVGTQEEMQAVTAAFVQILATQAEGNA